VLSSVKVDVLILDCHLAQAKADSNILHRELYHTPLTVTFFEKNLLRDYFLDQAHSVFDSKKAARVHSFLELVVYPSATENVLLKHRFNRLSAQIVTSKFPSKELTS